MSITLVPSKQNGVESMYHTVVSNLKHLKPVAMEDFFMCGSEELGVIVQVRVLAADWLQARVTSLHTQTVEHFDGNISEITDRLKPYIEKAAGLID